MDIRFVGVLKDPLDNPMPNHEIRITALHTDETIKGSTVVFYTDASGAYDFYLLKGFYSLEVLNTAGDEYLLTGNLYLNQSTPQNITLEEGLQYSVDVTFDDTVVLDATWSTWWNSLVNASLTQRRELRDQINDCDAHSVDLQETWSSEDDTENGAQRTLEVKAGNARIQEQHRVYDDEFAVTGSKVETSGASSHETVNVGTEIDRTKTQTAVTSNDVEKEHVGLEISHEKTSTTSSGSFKRLKELAATIRETVTAVFGSNSVSKKTEVSTTTLEEYVATVGSKATTIEHTNDGTTTERCLVVDKWQVGKTKLSPTLFVDTATGQVRVYGQLQVDGLLDENGDPVDLEPEDGDTIFPVYQYSDSPLGPWYDEVLPGRVYRRDNYSVNDVVDPNGWSAAYRFVGEDGVDGQPGDTITVEYQYSADGLVWHDPPLVSGDKYRRERIVTNGVAGDWSIAAQISGDNGVTVEVRSEYSIDGIYNWHTVLDPADKYERRATFENGSQVTPWSDPFAIGQGVPGDPGRNGSGWYTLVNATGNWPGDSTATIEFTNAFGRAPVLDDHLTYSNNADPSLASNTSTKRCNSDFGQPVTWSTPVQVVNGDFIALGTISGNRMVADTITGNEISSATTIIAGTGSWTAGMNGDDLSSAGVYRYWRFWAGATDPALAPFRVYRNGDIYVGNGTFNGTVYASAGSFTGAITASTLTLTGSTNITASDVGAETPSGAQSKANTAEANAKAASDPVGSADAAEAASNSYTENRIYPDQNSIQIKSANYSSGSTGWAIDANGNCEFNNGTFRGTLSGATGNFEGTVYARNLIGDLTSTGIKAVSSFTITPVSNNLEAFHTYASLTVPNVAGTSTATRTVIFYPEYLPEFNLVGGGEEEVKQYYRYRFDNGTWSSWLAIGTTAGSTDSENWYTPTAVAIDITNGRECDVEFRTGFRVQATGGVYPRTFPARTMVATVFTKGSGISWA